MIGLALLLAAATPAAPDSFDRWAETQSEAARFEGSPEAIKADVPIASWRAIRDGTMAVEPIIYSSGGLKITGFVVRDPKATGPRPVLIWARGGIGDLRQSEIQIAQMASMAARGYVVVGSNYRGAAGSEGKDEFAGADVDDLVALLPVIASIKGADPKQVYGLGFSRGGTMLLRAAAGRIPFRAIATAGAVTDLELAASERPELGKTFERMMPDHAAEAANHFCIRSAVCWPEKIAAPVLIAQGGDDKAVSVDHAVRLARAMEKADRPYRMIVFGGADHGISGFRQSFFDEADRFFRANAAR